jgi:hypothetical protein
MKKLKSIFALLSLLASSSPALAMTPAIEQKTEQKNEYNGDSDSDDGYVLNDPQQYPECEEMYEYWSRLEELTSHSPPDAQELAKTLNSLVTLAQPKHENAHRELDDHITRTLKLCPELNKSALNIADPNTGNTIVADYFLNHHSGNEWYLDSVVEELVDRGAHLENITRQGDSFFSLVNAAQKNNTLTQHQYALLVAAIAQVADHIKQHELMIAAQEKKARSRAYYEQHEQDMKRPQARRVKTRGPAILAITQDRIEDNPQNLETFECLATAYPSQNTQEVVV